MAAGMSTGMSWCTVKSVSPVSHSVVMDDRKAVLIRFSPLKDRSAEQVVTGRVHKILNKALILGYTLHKTFNLQNNFKILIVIIIGVNYIHIC